MDEHFYAVIMAGGGGTRLWPLSRKATPKQSIALFGERTLFQIAIDRLDGVFSPDRIYVVTIAEQAEQLHMQSPQIPTGNFLIEPMPRGTASVVAMAALTISKRDPQGTLAVLTADHFIDNVIAFQSALKAAFEVAQQGYLVTLGIPPTYPATGYGYIESGKLIGNYHGLDVFESNAFKEKPDEATAIRYLESGQYNWNSGMFIWRADVILQKFASHMPELHEKVLSLNEDLGINHLSDHFFEIWDSITPQTIDYGIMENSDGCAVIPTGNLDWNDVGSWDSLFDVMKPDQSGNILVHARHIGFETSNSLIYSTNNERLFVTIGMSDVILVDTGDAVLICPRGQSQKIKELVNYLHEHHLTPFL